MLNFTFTKLTALAGVFIFAVKSATVECAKPLRMVQLLSEVNGFYVTAYWPNGALRVDSVAYSHASTFEVHLVPGRNDQWQLRALKNNKYIAAANGGGSICTADRDIASGWETFTVTELGNNRVQLKTFDGHFLGIDGSLTSSLIATATKADSWETFKVVEVPQRRGVNAGSWLVPEKWMFKPEKCSELWAGTTSVDLFSLTATVSEKFGREEMNRRMKRHWSTWLTKTDFEIMASQGVNHVRLPIGHWDIVESPHYVFGGAEYIDMAIKWAAARGMTVSIDLHGAPGSQNGMDHSGRSPTVNWHLNSENIKLTVKVLGMISERWGENPAVWGIEMLNEPSTIIPRDILTQFYRDGYAAIRQHSPTVHVVMNSFGGQHESWKDALPEPQYRNVRTCYELG
ncbi:hypothetical protein ACHAXA_010375 [Cyclostephanos tholiformis]|uniref:Glucan 1,3-beta-glucosidase n=1 Tax=Cyclostephanos tholiformis TaxID=382380 RepID=A0ABD3RBC1_9STRA